MAAGKRSKSQEAYAARYKTHTFAANRKKKLERILKKQPNNEAVKMALKDIHYRRKTPKTPVWSSTAKREVSVVTEFAKANKQVRSDTIQAKNMFSLKARIKLGTEFVFVNSTKLAGLVS